MLSISDQLDDTDDMKDEKIEDKRSLHNRTIAKVFMNLDDDLLWTYIFVCPLLYIETRLLEIIKN